MESEIEKLRLKVATLEGEMKAIRAENESGWRGLQAYMAQSQKQMLMWFVGIAVGVSTVVTGVLGALIVLGDGSSSAPVVVNVPPSLSAPVAESSPGATPAQSAVAPGNGR